MAPRASAAALSVVLLACTQPSSPAPMRAYQRGQTGVVAPAAEPGQQADVPAAPGKEQRFAERIARLRHTLPRSFTIVASPPFVVIGNDSPAEVRRRARRTVQWAVRHLRASFFQDEPDRILDIYLFKDDASYRRYARRLFGDEPETPYGYYSSQHGALVMNISTGGGTLVHEIVHPFVEANIPNCPPWFNEGLGSLYEASAERDGRIVGLLNWRLPGLQRAIARGEVPSFETLTGFDDSGFYDDDTGVNYAQARYLLYYLQERGLLRRYYRELSRNRRSDPTGYDSLRRVLGDPDMDELQRRWERYIAGLRWRR